MKQLYTCSTGNTRITCCADLNEESDEMLQNGINWFGVLHHVGGKCILVTICIECNISLLPFCNTCIQIDQQSNTLRLGSELILDHFEFTFFVEYNIYWIQSSTSTCYVCLVQWRQIVLFTLIDRLKNPIWLKVWIVNILYTTCGTFIVSHLEVKSLTNDKKHIGCISIDCKKENCTIPYRLPLFQSSA